MITFSKLGQFGRLGNQLFQIAALLGYANNNNSKYFMPEWNYARYFDYKFNINKRRFKTFSEQDFTYAPIPVRSAIDIEGYFQSEKYFEGIDMKDVFKFRSDFKTLALDKYGDLFTRETCSIHIRRGDYLTMPDWHYNLDIDYYYRAIGNFKEETWFLVFSDDIEWCKENLSGHNFVFIDGNKDIFDLYLMSICKHNIIANSSFSWWGSYLNKNTDKKVIAPTKDKWFGPKMNKSVDDLYLNNWILA